MSLLSMLHGLEQANIRFVVIGGVAATLHGSVRITDDLDLCYDTTGDNLRTLATLLTAWRAYLRGAPPDLPFTLDARALRTTPLLTLSTDQGDIDVMDRVPGVGDYEACFAHSTQVDLEDIQIRVLSLPALITAKRTTGRRKDQEHLIELEALLSLQTRSHS